jgi:hypothetical protein
MLLENIYNITVNLIIKIIFFPTAFPYAAEISAALQHCLAPRYVFFAKLL